MSSNKNEQLPLETTLNVTIQAPYRFFVLQEFLQNHQIKSCTGPLVWKRCGINGNNLIAVKIFLKCQRDSVTDRDTEVDFCYKLSHCSVQLDL